MYFPTMQESSNCFWPEGSGSAGVDGAEEVYGKLTVTMKRLSGYGDITERRLEVAGDITTQDCHTPAAVQLAPGGGTTSLRHTLSGRPPQQGPEDQPQQTHHYHVQVRIVTGHGSQIYPAN